MKTCWVVMASAYSPVAFVIPSPVSVHLAKKDAQKVCDEHNNSNRTRTQYYMRKAEFKGEYND